MNTMNSSRFSEQWVDIYSSSELRAKTALSLIGMASTIFKRAYLIQHLDEWEAVTRRFMAKSITPSEAGITLGPFMLERLLDEIKVCVFFENYLKAILIQNGYIVHVFQGNGQHLRKIQRKKPVEIGAIDAYNLTSSDLQKQTISLGLMLGEPAYLTVLGTPPEVVAFLKDLNDRRNELHLHHGTVREDNIETISNFRRLNSIVDHWIAFIKEHR